MVAARGGVWGSGSKEPEAGGGVMWVSSIQKFGEIFRLANESEAIGLHVFIEILEVLCPIQDNQIYPTTSSELHPDIPLIGHTSLISERFVPRGS